MPRRHNIVCAKCGKRCTSQGRKYCSTDCYFSDPLSLVKQKGRMFSDEHRAKISRAAIGRVPWNKGKPWGEDTRTRIARAAVGRVPWNKGVPRTDKEKRKVSLNHANVKGVNNPNYGNGSRTEGEKNPNWRGGKTFEEYGIEFNNRLRAKVRKRDGHECQRCKRLQHDLGYRLQVHHIDYDKKNNEPRNLISLCRSCHSATNWNREYWTAFFHEHFNLHTCA